MAPVLIKSVRKIENQYDNAPEYNQKDPINIVNVNQIFKIYLDMESTNCEDCYIVINAKYVLKGYRNGKWTNIKYVGFFSTLEEAENFISGHI